ncbi:DUF2812 domain-containing protein [Bacillus sp. EB01]|uniref:DUF2812 domain-containing protein n=1 Tax=Bacillus sp. EB01 TaxID=1347086 RepID=UPI0005C5152E|nr:DUF2812 domain-containing protein [Bacillus sp. EB01]
MKKACRPLWSYNVEKTEAWLSGMAQKGYFLDRLNRGTRSFSFRQDSPQSLTYRIGYEKVKGAMLPRSLVNEGWQKVLHTGNWYIIANEQPPEQVKTSPVREGIIKRNRIHMYIFAGIVLYFTMLLVMNLSMLAFTLLNDVPVEVVPSPMWVITYAAFALAVVVYILCLYQIILIYKTNKSLLNSTNKKQYTASLDKEAERQLKRSGQLIVKRKFGWMYSPDKLEKWLEDMEARGYNLHRVGRTGTAFYFIIGSPRKMRYSADYQNITDESYFDMHRDAGWKSVFISKSVITKWTIWSREFSEGEQPPQLYSEKSHHLKHAKRIAVTHTVIFLPIVIMYLFNIVAFTRYTAPNGKTGLDLYNTVAFIICIIIFGSFTVRTWLFYWRLRKAYDF